jgi:hypothetical protein
MLLCPGRILHNKTIEIVDNLRASQGWTDSGLPTDMDTSGPSGDLNHNQKNSLLVRFRLINLYTYV